jgi:hypothetical protein
MSSPLSSDSKITRYVDSDIGADPDAIDAVPNAVQPAVPDAEHFIVPGVAHSSIPDGAHPFSERAEGIRGGAGGSESKSDTKRIWGTYTVRILWEHGPE